jgi:hypothetical protein
MTWSHIQKRIASVLQDGNGKPKWHDRAVVKDALQLWPKLEAPFWALANSHPTLAGAASVFNLAGTLDEPIVGLMQPGISTEEALELLPFHVGQAERILRQADEIVAIAALMQSAKKRSGKRFGSFS